MVVDTPKIEKKGYYFNLSIKVAAKDQSASARKAGDTTGASTSAAAAGDGTGNSNGAGAGTAGGSGNQQQDWSILWSCFDNPLTLLATTENLPKGMQVFLYTQIHIM